jgi:hypothetical protein
MVTPRRAAVALIAAYSRGSSAGAMWGRRSLVVHVT